MKIHPDALNICRDFHAWIVGSVANPYKKNPSDCDIIVEPEHYNLAVNYLSGEKSLNSFNGVRVKYHSDKYLNIDLWCSSLTNHIQNSKFKVIDGEDIYIAWNPTKNIRVTI